MPSTMPRKKKATEEKTEAAKPTWRRTLLPKGQFHMSQEIWEAMNARLASLPFRPGQSKYFRQLIIDDLKANGFLPKDFVDNTAGEAS